MVSFTWGLSSADFCSESMKPFSFSAFASSQELERRALLGLRFISLNARSRLNLVPSSSKDSRVADTASRASGLGTPAPLNSMCENLGMQRTTVAKSTVWKNQSPQSRSAISLRHSSSTMFSTFLTYVMRNALAG